MNLPAEATAVFLIACGGAVAALGLAVIIAEILAVIK